MDEAINDDPLQCLAVHAADKCIENLNRQTPSGMPPHELDLKVGAIMMLIKNLSIADGLCNGTRLQIVAIKSENVLTCRYITGPRKGNTFDLYKCPFEHGGGARKEGEAAFRWKRIQFPLRPGFVLTINKSQGQTLDRVGLLLQNSQCFNHGQLYVAASRVRDPNSLKILIREGANSVQNVVHQPILDQQEIDNAYKFAEEDGDRNLISATPNTIGTTATISTDNSTPRTSKVNHVSATATTNTIASSSTTTKKPTRPALSPTLPGQSTSAGTNNTTSNSPANPPTQTAQQHNVEGDGNCLFRSVSYCMARKETLFVGLRRKAVQGLIWIDNNATEEQKEYIRDMIGGGLPRERIELEQTYGDCITQYAENYTAKNKNWGGAAEVMALAIILRQPVIIINEREELREGQGEICMAYRPDMTMERHNIRQGHYEQLWQLEDNPIVVTHNGQTHFQAVYINNA